MTIVIMILKFLWTMAKKIPWQVYACAGVGICFWLWGTWQYQQGQKETQDRWDVAVKQGKARIEELKRGQLTVTMQVDTIYKERVKVIHEKADTIIKYIPQYIPVDTPDLPGGFRLLHDAAATSTIPASPGSIEAAPVSVADATETITLNYAQCLVWREEAVTWRQWYTDQYQLYEDLRKR